SDRFGMQVDILYSQQGGKEKDKMPIMEYVTIPVVLKYYLVDGLNAQIGPQAAFMRLHNLNEQIGGDLEIRKTDFSGIVGVGYDFPFGMRFDVRYHIGFLDVLQQINGKNDVFSL